MVELVIFSNGDKHWRFRDNRKLHREYDLPAIVFRNGDKQWWFNGKRHRGGDLPAIERTNGNRLWFLDGKKHRDGGKPAVIRGDGTKEWWIENIDMTAFREKYYEALRIRAQKKIYFWIIPKLYRPGSESAKRLVEKSWQNTVNEMEVKLL